MDCPKCGLVNPESAQRCDCGYDFKLGRMEKSYIPPAKPKVKPPSDRRLRKRKRDISEGTKPYFYSFLALMLITFWQLLELSTSGKYLVTISIIPIPVIAITAILGLISLLLGIVQMFRNLF